MTRLKVARERCELLVEPQSCSSFLLLRQRGGPCRFVHVAGIQLVYHFASPVQAECDLFAVGMRPSLSAEVPGLASNCSRPWQRARPQAQGSRLLHHPNHRLHQTSPPRQDPAVARARAPSRASKARPRRNLKRSRRANSEQWRPGTRESAARLHFGCVGLAAKLLVIKKSSELTQSGPVHRLVIANTNHQRGSESSNRTLKRAS